MADSKPSDLHEAHQNIRDKRDAYDLEQPVRQNVPGTLAVHELVDAGSRESKNPKKLTITQQGTTTRLEIGKESIELDADGLAGASRIFGDLGAAV